MIHKVIFIQLIRRHMKMQREERDFLEEHAELLSAIATKVLRAQMEIREFIWRQETDQKLEQEKDEDEAIPNPVRRIP